MTQVLGKYWKGHSKYRSSKNPDGKVEVPMSDAEFDKGIREGHFVQPLHKAYSVLLWYSAIREGEGLKAIREQFNRNPDGDIVFEVGERFKKARYRKTCPKCLDPWNSARASFCKCCGADINNVETVKVKTKTVKTPPLTLPVSAPHMLILQDAIEETPRGERLFKFSPGTAYNVIHRVWNYPHLLRLTRISWFLSHGWTPQQIHSWTGLSLAAIDYYVGLVEVAKMGRSMGSMEKTLVK